MDFMSSSDDWTTDDSLSEEEIRRKMAAEGWEPVQPLSTPVTSNLEETTVSVRTNPVWSHSEDLNEHVRMSAA